MAIENPQNDLSPIKLGSSLALSGQLGEYGRSQLLGTEMYF
jgi:hypothetical protein